jgi:hypothetical protein
VPNCRLATLAPGGAPYVVPRWFIWLEDGLFVATRRGGVSWDNVERDSRVSVVVDQGRDWTDLSGVRVDGAAEAIPAEHPEIRGVMSAHEKHVAGRGDVERLTQQVGPDSSATPARWMRGSPCRVRARIARSTGPGVGRFVKPFMSIA